MPYHNISTTPKQLLDYSFWHLPDTSKLQLYTNIKRIHLRELYATIYLNLYEQNIITKETEPQIYNTIPKIKSWKENKHNLKEHDKKNLLYQINTSFYKLNNKYLIHQVLQNLYNTLIKDNNIIYIDTDVIYLNNTDNNIIKNLNKVYGNYPSELHITNIDYLYIIRHKLLAEQIKNITKTNLDRLIIHRQNNTVKSKIVTDNIELLNNFNILIREDKLNKILK
jgi:hypothetical protein